MTQPNAPSAFDKYLAVTYTPDLAEVVITGDVLGLTYLRDLLSNLIARPVSGRHYHIDDFDGLAGNIPHLVLVVKPDRPDLPTSR